MKPTTTLPFGAQTSALSVRRRVVNLAVTLFSTICLLFAISVFFYILWYIVSEGHTALNLAFFTQLPVPDGQTGGGVAQSIVGTLILVGLASLVGIPLGLFTGLYLAEYAHNRFSGFIRLVVDVLAGIPTIIFGLFAYTIIVIPQTHPSAFSGGIALGIIMIPIVTRTTEDVLHLVPETLREAALALGIPEWRTVLQIVLPSVRSGILTGIVLALARVAGETAPLLFTAFGNTFFNTDISQPIDSLTYRIYYFTESPYAAQNQQAFAGALLLVLLIVSASLIVRIATGGFRRTAR